jgi:hypothetical protein
MGADSMGVGGSQETGRKRFFFEKKKQKTFAPGGRVKRVVFAPPCSPV